MTVAINVRNITFDVRHEDIAVTRLRDPLSVAFFAGLSALFPDGERFFVQSVRRLAHHADNGLAADVDAFVRQEGHHAREHSTYNREIEETGVPMARLVGRALNEIGVIRRRSDIGQLATTVGLEHFTAVFAAHLLKDPAHLAYADPEERALWRWHAVEEIEHKCVAFDLFMRATQDWSPFRRWWYRCGSMLDATARLLKVTIANMLDIMAVAPPHQRGVLRLVYFLLCRPGIGRAMAGEIAQFLVPGFHPTRIADAPLVAAARAEPSSLATAYP